MAVGYPAKRGVVAAASYEARRFGVRSAMPSTLAMRRCPDLVFVAPRFEVYRAVSQQIHAIFNFVKFNRPRATRIVASTLSFGGEAERTIGQPSAPGGNGYSAAADPTGKTKPGLRSLAPSLLGASEGRRHMA